MSVPLIVPGNMQLSTTVRSNDFSNIEMLFIGSILTPIKKIKCPHLERQFRFCK